MIHNAIQTHCKAHCGISERHRAHRRQAASESDVSREESPLVAVDFRSSTPACPDDPPAMSMSQRMGTIYPGELGATGRQARARSLAEHATSITTEKTNDRCRTTEDLTAEEKHSKHNRTNIATRQAPAWAPFTFQELSSQLRHAAHGRFVKTRPARHTSTHLRSRHAREAPAGGSIVAQTKRDTVPRGVPARCRTGRLEEPWHAQPNAPRPRATGAATSG